MRELKEHEKDFIEQLKMAPFFHKMPQLSTLIEVLENTDNEHEFVKHIYVLKDVLLSILVDRLKHDKLTNEIH